MQFPSPPRSKAGSFLSRASETKDLTARTAVDCNAAVEHATKNHPSFGYLIEMTLRTLWSGDETSSLDDGWMSHGSEI